MENDLELKKVDNKATATQLANLKRKSLGYAINRRSMFMFIIIIIMAAV